MTKQEQLKLRRTELLNRIVIDHDEKARELFIEENMPLVHKIAQRNTGRGVDFEDLTQEGVIGLIDALERFDINRGNEFSTYAVWWIRQAIEQACLRNQFGVDKPGNYSEMIKLITKTVMSFNEEFGRKPSLEELSAITHISINKLKGLFRLAAGVVSLESAVTSSNEDNTSRYADVLVDDNDILHDQIHRDTVDLKIIIDKALSILSDKEKNIMIMRYGLFDSEVCSLRDIASMLDVSPERVRQIERRAIKKLKGNYETRKLFEDYYVSYF